MSTARQVQTDIEVLASSGAVERMRSTEDEFICGACGSRISGEKVVGVMGPDNAFDEAFEGSPLCGKCEPEHDDPIEAINRHYQVTETPERTAAEKAAIRRARKKVAGGVRTYNAPLTAKALYEVCRTLVENECGDTPVIVLAESALYTANMATFDKMPGGDHALIVGHE